MDQCTRTSQTAILLHRDGLPLPNSRRSSGAPAPPPHSRRRDERVKSTLRRRPASHGFFEVSLQRWFVRPCVGAVVRHLEPLAIKAASAHPRTTSLDAPDLDLRGLLRRLDLLFHRLESGGEHGSGQLGYLAAIADGGFDAVLDQLAILRTVPGFSRRKVPESRQSDSWRS